MKKKKIKKHKSAILDSLRNLRGGKMRDRRLRRSKEKKSIIEDWE